MTGEERKMGSDYTHLALAPSAAPLL